MEWTPNKAVIMHVTRHVTMACASTNKKQRRKISNKKKRKRPKKENGKTQTRAKCTHIALHRLLHVKHIVERKHELQSACAIGAGLGGEVCVERSNDEDCMRVGVRVNGEVR